MLDDSGGEKAKCFIEDSHEAIFSELEGGGAESFIKNSREAIFRPLGKT